MNIDGIITKYNIKHLRKFGDVYHGKINNYDCVIHVESALDKRTINRILTSIHNHKFMPRTLINLSENIVFINIYDTSGFSNIFKHSKSEIAINFLSAYYTIYHDNRINYDINSDSNGNLYIEPIGTFGSKYENKHIESIIGDNSRNNIHIFNVLLDIFNDSSSRPFKI